MTEKIKEQILTIRDSGKVNMLSVHEVQHLAYEQKLYDLVVFIEDHRKEYVHFILYGKD